MEVRDRKTIAPKTASVFMSAIMLGTGVAPTSVLANADNGIQTASNGGSSIVIQNNDTDKAVPKVVPDAADASGLITDTESTTDDGIIVESLDDVKPVDKTDGSGIQTESKMDDDSIVIEDVPVTKRVRKAAARAADYIVTFNADGGTFPNGDTTKNKTYSGEIGDGNLPADPTKSGATFVGWFTGQNGAGTRVMELSNLGANTTVYAYFTTGNTKEITLNMGCDYGDTYSFDDSVVKKTYKIVVPITDGNWNIGVLPTPNPNTDDVELKFRGWYETEDLTSAIYDNAIVSEDVTTIYASFSRKIKLSFRDSQGNSYPSVDIWTYESLRDQGITLPTPTVTDMSFEGWYLQPANFGDVPITSNQVFGDTISYQIWQCLECDYDTTDYNAMISHIGSTNHAYTFYTDSATTSEVVLYSKYLGKRVDITFDSQGGFVQENGSVVSYEEDTTIGDIQYKAGFGYAVGNTSSNYISQCGALPGVVRDGYVFLGWYDKPEGGDLFNPIYKLSEDITLYAHWELDNRILYFNPNGGSLPEDFVGNTMEVLHTTKPESLPEPKHSERKFLGWFTEPTGGEQVTTDTVILKDMGLYAHWGPAAYEVDLDITFDATGGTCDVASKTINMTQGLGSLPIPTRDGYSFVGWFTAPEGGEQVTAFTRFEEDTTIYAVWVKGDVSVSSISLSHSTLEVTRPSSVTQVEIAGLTATVSPADATNQQVWWSSSNSSVVYVNGDGKLFARSEGTAIVTAHSLDGKVTASCTVTVKVEDDGDDPGACKKVDSLYFVYPEQTVRMGDAIKLDVRYGPEHAHNALFRYSTSDPEIISVASDAEYWSFGGKTGDCTITVSTEDGTISAQMKVTVTEYTTVDPTVPNPDIDEDPITPQNPNRTVTFDTTGGEAIPSITVPDGESVRLPMPTKVGYAFKGWYRANGTKINSEFIIPVANMIVYAHWEEIPKPVICTVTFDPQNGMPAIRVEVQRDSQIGAFPEVSSAGQTLIGWFTKPIGGDQVSTTQRIRKDVTFYAQWDFVDPKTYTLTMDPAGGQINGTDGCKVPATYLTENANTWSDISSFVPTRQGYTFLGWADEDRRMVYDANGKCIEGKYWSNGMYVGGENLVVYAMWNKNPILHTLTFDSRGGNFVNSQKYEKGTMANHLPTPTRAGYIFDGWFDKATGGRRVVCIQMDDDYTLYAHWTKVDPDEQKKVVTIQLETGIPDNKIQPYVVDEGTVIALPDLTGQREGYIFKGWYTEPDCKGTRLLSLTASRDMTIYAGWEEAPKLKPKYQITFDYQDGGTIQVLEREVGESIDDFPNAIRPGYQFLGWFDQPEGGKRYVAWHDGDTRMFYAQWEKEDAPIVNDRYYTVHFNAMGGSIYQEYVSVLEGVLVPMPNTSKEGYTFDGWYDKAVGGTRIDSMVASADVTLYAHWVPVEQTISTYSLMLDHRDAEDNASGTITSMMLEEDQVVEKLPEIEKADDEFEGWYTKPKGGKEVKTVTADSDIMLYARWESDNTPNPPQASDSTVNPDGNEHRINFVTMSDDVSLAPLYVKDGQIIASLPTPYRAGYRFDGWFTQSTGGQQAIGMVVTKTLWLYAHWTQVNAPDDTPPTKPGVSGSEEDSEISGATSTLEFKPYVTYRANKNTAKISWKGLAGYIKSEYNGDVASYQVIYSGDMDGETQFSNKTTSCTLTDLDPDDKYELILRVNYTRNSGAAGQFDIPVVIPADRGGLGSGSLDDNTIRFEYTVDFDTQVDGLTVDSVTASSGVSVKLPSLSYPGKTFDGWYTAKTGGQKVESLVLSDNMTLYAHWVDNGSNPGNPGSSVNPDGKTYTVVFDYQDGSTRTITENIGTALGALPTASRDGYTFVGWFTDPSGGMEVSSYNDSKNITFYAHWVRGGPGNSGGDSDVTTPSGPGENQFTLTFNTQGGDLIDPVYVDKGATVDSFPTPVRDGYKFLGWYNAPTGGKAISGVVVKSDVTLYAQWKSDSGAVDSYSITLSANGGKFSDGLALHTWSEVTGSIKDPNIVLAGLVPKRSGYTFLGYSYDRSGGELVTSVVFDSSVENRVLYAQWENINKPNDPDDTGTPTPTPGGTDAPTVTPDPDDDDNTVTPTVPVVEDNVVKKLELNTHSLIVTRGDLINLSYTFSPKNADNAEFVWTSSNEEVIAVTNGAFKYVGTGVTTLTVSTKDGSISDSCEITVKPVPGTNNNNGNNNNNNSNNGGTTNNGSSNMGTNGSTNGSTNPGTNNNLNTGNNGSGNTNNGTNGSGNKANQIVDYVLTMTSVKGSTTRVTVKSNVTLESLAGKLGYEPAAFSVRTSVQDEHRIDSNTSMYAIAELAESGEVLVIAIDKNGKAIGGAKVTKTGENNYKVVMTKDTTVALRSNSDLQGVNGNGKGNNPGGGSSNPGDDGADGSDGSNGSDGSGGGSGFGGEGARGTTTSDGSPVTNTGKSSKEASSVRTADSPMVPVFGGILGGLMALVGFVFAKKRKK